MLLDCCSSPSSGRVVELSLPITAICLSLCCGESDKDGGGDGVESATSIVPFVEVLENGLICIIICPLRFTTLVLESGLRLLMGRVGEGRGVGLLGWVRCVVLHVLLLLRRVVFPGFIFRFSWRERDILLVVGEEGMMIGRWIDDCGFSRRW